MRSIWMGTAGFAALAIAMPAQAQEAEDGVGLEEIVVTAQKRDQALQDVPISVSVLTADTIERSQVSNIQDLGTKVPSVSIAQFGSRAEVGYLFIRGLGNNSATKTLRAATIIDDVPVTDFYGLNNNLIDIEQVEVLRGPQSTLYGLTAEAGLIVLKTRKPGNDFGGRVSVQATSERDYLVSGSLDIPIVKDVLAINVSGVYDKRDGFIRSQLLEDDYDKGESTTFKARALLTPADGISFDLTYIRDRIDDEFGQAFIPVDRAAYVTRNDNPVARATSLIPFTSLSPLGKFENATDFRGFSTVDLDAISLRTAADLGFAELVSVSAYRDAFVGKSFDIGMTPGGVLGGLAQNGVTPSIETESMYQELRLVSSNSDGLKWIVGGTYYWRSVTSAPLRLGTAFGELPFGDAFKETFSSRSLFVQGEYSPTDKFDIVAGLRYEDTSSRGVNRGGYSGLLGPSPAEIADNGFESRQGSDILLPKVTFSYLPSENVRFYATVARGWLPGAADSDPEAGDDGVIDAEKSWTYEIGLKSNLLDNRLRLNAAIYQTDVRDYQESTFVGPVNQIFENVPAVRFRGFEVDFEAAVADWLTLSGGFAYTDATYREFAENLTTAVVDRAGNRIAAVPDYNFTLGADVNFTDQLFARAEIVGAGSFLERNDRSGGNGTSVTSGGVTTVLQPALGSFGKHQVVNLKLGYDGDVFSVLAFANNIFNKRYFNLVTNTYALNGPTDVNLLGSPGRPFEFGGRVSIKF